MMWVDAEHTAIRDGGRVIPADPSIPEFAAIDLSDVAEYVPPPTVEAVIAGLPVIAWPE